MRPWMICRRLKVLAERFYKVWDIRLLVCFSPSAPSASPRDINSAARRIVKGYAAVMGTSDSHASVRGEPESCRIKVYE